MAEKILFTAIFDRLLERTLSDNSHFLEEFFELTSISARMSLLGAMLEEHNLLTTIEDFVHTEKDNVKSAEIRIEGNVHMQSTSRSLLSAAEMYNRALAHAEDGSEAMARAYANRSAVCYALKEYESCVENIEMAKKRGDCNDALLKRLEERRKSCVTLLSVTKDSKRTEPYEAKLSYQANPKIPRIVNGVELHTNEVEGRHLVANQNFTVGDILLIDEPYTIAITEEFIYQRCHHCLRAAILLLRPCTRCKSAMFCSEACENLALKVYHRFECPVLEEMFAMGTEIATISSRIVCTAISDFDDNLDLLEAHIAQIDKQYSPFQIDWNGLTARQMYDTVHTLATNEDKQSCDIALGYTMGGYLISELLLRHSPLLKKLADTQHRQTFIRALIYHHQMTAVTNMRVSISYGEFIEPQNMNKGFAAYPIYSMMNHSCCANTMRIDLPGGRIAAMVTRPIKMGQQVYDNYGFHYKFDSKEVRKLNLKRVYRFCCHCEACDGNYPTIQSNAGCDAYTSEDKLEIRKICAALSECPPADVTLTLLKKTIQLVNRYYVKAATHDLSLLTLVFMECISSLFNEPELQE